MVFGPVPGSCQIQSNIPSGGVEKISVEETPVVYVYRFGIVSWKHLGIVGLMGTGQKSEVQQGEVLGPVLGSQLR